MSNLLHRLNPRPLVRAPGLPSYARVQVTVAGHRVVLWVTCYLPERRGAAIDMIEEPLELRDVVIGLRGDGDAVHHARCSPGGEALEPVARDGYTWVTIPRVVGWCAVTLERGPGV